MEILNILTIFLSFYENLGITWVTLCVYKKNLGIYGGSLERHWGVFRASLGCLRASLWKIRCIRASLGRLWLSLGWLWRVFVASLGASLYFFFVGSSLKDPLGSKVVLVSKRRTLKVSLCRQSYKSWGTLYIKIH